MLQEFTEEIEETAAAVVNGIHTAMPGEILSFDAGSGTASVQPVGKFVTSDGNELDYPLITEVPVVFPFCQQIHAGMAFPVKKGDSCIVIISEVELDAWRGGAESEGTLRFDLTNAVAIPGLLKGGSALVQKAADQNAVFIGTSGAEVGIFGDYVRIRTAGAQLEVSESGITAGGNLKVNGSIFYTGVCQKA